MPSHQGAYQRKSQGQKHRILGSHMPTEGFLTCLILSLPTPGYRGNSSRDLFISRDLMKLQNESVKPASWKWRG